MVSHSSSFVNGNQPSFLFFESETISFYLKIEQKSYTFIKNISFSTFKQFLKNYKKLFFTHLFPIFKLSLTFPLQKSLK